MEILLKMKVEDLQKENKLLREEMNKLCLMYKDALLEINDLKHVKKEPVPEQRSFRFEESDCKHWVWRPNALMMTLVCQDCGKSFSSMRVSSMSVAERKAYRITL